MAHMEQPNSSSDNLKEEGKHVTEFLQKEEVSVVDGRNKRSKTGEDMADKLAALSKGKNRENVDQWGNSELLQRIRGRIRSLGYILNDLVDGGLKESFVITVSGYFVTGKLGKGGNVQFEKGGQGGDSLKFTYLSYSSMSMSLNGGEIAWVKDYGEEMRCGGDVALMLKKLEKFEQILHNYLSPAKRKKDVEKF